MLQKVSVHRSLSSLFSERKLQIARSLAYQNLTHGGESGYARK